MKFQRAVAQSLFFIGSLLFGITNDALSSEFIAITIGGHHYDAALEKNTRLDSQLNISGASTESPDNTIHYQGELQNHPDSWIRASLIDGSWQGILSLAGETYMINDDNTARLNLSTDDTSALKISTSSATILSATPVTGPSEELACGTPPSGIEQQESSVETITTVPQHSPLSFPNQAKVAFSTLCSAGTTIDGICLFAELEIIFDSAFQQEFGSSAQNQATAIINIMEGFYRNNFNIAFDTITLAIATTEIFSNTSILNNGELDEDELLPDLLTQRQNNQITQLHSERSLFHVVTGREISGSTAGIAFLGTVCRLHSAVGVSELLRSSVNNQPLPSLTALIIAHELGHNLGARHDGDINNCPDDQFIMASSLSPGLTDFSSCSITAISDQISTITTPSQCFNFPADVNITADNNNPTTAAALSDITLNYQVTTNSGFNPIASIRVIGSVPINQGDITSVTLAGNACTSNSSGYQCDLSNPQSSSSLQINFRGEIAGTSQLTHQVSIQNSPDILETNNNNNQLTTSLAITAPAPVATTSSGGGGGGGSISWPAMILLTLLLGLKKHRHKMTPLLVLPLLTGVLACSPLASEPDDLNLAKTQWDKQTLINYDYSVTKSCYCQQEYRKPMRVKVRDGLVVSAIYSETQKPVPEKIVKSLRSIDQWFSYIDAGKAKGYEKLEVQYNKEKGFPSYIVADPHSQISDDNQEVKISDIIGYSQLQTF